MHVKKIFDIRIDYWVSQNIKFFGIYPRDWSIFSEDTIKEELKKDAKDYWNCEEPCEIMQMILSGQICRDNKKLVKDSIELIFNNLSECVDVYGTFDPKGKNNKDDYVTKLIMSLPTPDINLCWIINKLKYTPRITTFRDMSLIRREKDNIKQPNKWVFNTKTKEFTILAKDKNGKPVKLDPFKSLTYKSVRLLRALLGEELTRENFEEALCKVPEFDKNSIYMFSFKHLSAFFNYVRLGKRFASPLKNIPLAVNLAFLQQNGDIYDVNNKLVISQNPIYSLESFSTIVYKTKYNFNFTYEDATLFFDAFKTSTNKSAGRQRLLLDNIFVKDDMLWIRTEDGAEYDMYELMMKPELQTQSISTMSTSLFCNNNTPKRIMMTAKLSSQSIPVIGQINNFTNNIPARVVFGEFEGWSFADSILISESFAKKLTSIQILPTEIRKRDKGFDKIVAKISMKDYKLNFEDLCNLFPSVNRLILKNYEKPEIYNYNMISPNIIKLNIRIELPFLPGDKLTNLHGSKGVVGLIIPDDEMPRLKNDIGNFKAGPFDVIISGLSVMRRNSLGQLFEAWANASGIEFKKGEDFIKKAVMKYSKEMKEFSEKSIIVFKGKESIKPCGIINMIRLHHYATTKASISYIKTNSNKMLKLEEMIKLNLAANGCTKILTELGIRSTRKHSSAFKMIYDMMKDRKLPRNILPSLNFNRILHSMGVDMRLSGKSLVNIDDMEPNPFFKQLYEHTVNNNLLDIIQMFEQEDELNANKRKV
mgnify:FL=1